ncbi:TonB-dependent receptor-like superfamily protein [Desulfonema limicola]|uniref:TonB-dependent receptor-like superfamily protein n=1 Tax=Desulfonema limicola TaxID=45656 RepID=A0A975GGV4_9BACT|nr:TonB-dependent receptor [Desulfonema limicola]QTA80608.1 TonB-dependent receptor-like superfamily protein [Desulfonema limicola]
MFNLKYTHIYLSGILTICLFTAVITGTPVLYAENSHDDTMLMFVGENLEVLTIASRREESAWQAPAVAHVITKKAFQERGADTLSKALETIPGFYMAKPEWGTKPYFRGIPDSMLLLYDTVSVTSDISKSIHPFDHELSLVSVKRIEIIKGPGSVLWGPDAFAGIINIVPMTGKDMNGVETGILYQTPGNNAGTYINMGYDAGRWDSFLSISGYAGKEDDNEYNVLKFWGDTDKPADINERYGFDNPETSRYIEAVGRFSFDDWLNISTRLTDNKKAYTITSEEDMSWCETRENPSGLIKIEAKKAINHLSHVRMTGSFFHMETQQQIIDRKLKQRENEFYGEVLYDRSVLSGSGLFTGGVSYREKHIKNAPIWDGYLPDYLKSENLFLLPILTETNYNTNLWSLFCQYSHRFGNTEAWFGIRNDNHDSYQDRTSFSTGLSWSPSSEWIIKLLYGTAYRTPFAKQLQENEKTDLENIETLNLQIGWEPSWQWGLGFCGYWSRLEDHVMEDPYAGLSKPNHQEFTGAEIQGHYSPFRFLKFETNLTLINNKGPNEEYTFLKETYIDSSGNEIRTYEDRSYPYDSGPGALLDFIINWKPVKKISSNLRISYTGSRQLIHPRGQSFMSSSGVWLADINTIIRDIIMPDTDLEISIRNITDREYETPGIYSTIEGEGINAQIVLRKNW